MYEMPSLYHTRNYLVDTPSFALELLSIECKYYQYPCDEDFYRLCNILMWENGMSHKENPHDAVDLYIYEV